MDEFADAMIDREENYFGLRSWRARHETGSKDYHAILLMNTSRNAYVMLNRWGKVGAEGEMQIFTASTARMAVAAFEKKIRDKCNKSRYTKEIPNRAAPPVRATELKVHIKDLRGFLTQAELNYLMAHAPQLFGSFETSAPFPTSPIPTYSGVVTATEPPAPKVNPYENDAEWGLF